MNARALGRTMKQVTSTTPAAPLTLAQNPDDLLGRIAKLENIVDNLKTRVEDLSHRLSVCEHPQNAGSYDGTLLLAALDAAGWTQRDLARGLGKSPQSLNRYVRGRSKVPRYMADRIVAIFIKAGAEPPAFDFTRGST